MLSIILSARLGPFESAARGIPSLYIIIYSLLKFIDTRQTVAANSLVHYFPEPLLHKIQP